jgi:hypothetical protein
MKAFTEKVIANRGTASPKTTCNRSTELAKKSGRWMETVIKGLAFCICGVALLSVGKATAANFSFTTIADTSSNFTSFSVPTLFGQSSPAGVSAINDSGTVAFLATSDTGASGVYTANNGAITAIVNNNGLESLFGSNLPTTANERFALGSFLDINNNNTVAFIIDSNSFSGNQEKIFTSQNGNLITRVSTGRSFTRDGITNFDLNDKDEIAYVRETGFKTIVDNLIISRPNQPNVEVFRATQFLDLGPQTGLISIEGFAINNQSEVTFDVIRSDDFRLPPRSVLFRSSGGVLTTLVDSTRIFGLDVNDRGDVVFGSGEVFFNNTGRVVDINAIRQFNNATGELTTIADTSGVFSQFGSSAINNSGSIAFTASLDEGGEGIFQIADSELHEVITTGDALNGSTVTNLNFFREGFNNNGQIAFFAELADGTQGIFRAERSTPPTSVPEPASALGLLVLGSLGLVKKPRIQ